MQVRVGIGQDSHRFLATMGKVCVIGGIEFPEDGLGVAMPGLDADSDGDVIFHAICNAISSVTGVPILGGIAQEMCKDGRTDSALYLQEAMKTLGKQKVTHVALTVEARRPRLQAATDKIRENVAKEMGLAVAQIGMTSTSGDGLTDFGRGIGIQCLCILTTQEV